MGLLNRTGHLGEVPREFPKEDLITKITTKNDARIFLDGALGLVEIFEQEDTRRIGKDSDIEILRRNPKSAKNISDVTKYGIEKIIVKHIEKIPQKDKGDNL